MDPDGCLPFIYAASRPAAPAFYPPPYLQGSGEQPSDDGLHELAASSPAQPGDHPPAGGLLHRLLTLTPSQGGGGCFLLHGLLLPIASIFGSGVLCAARTFLPRISCVSGRAGALFSVCKVTVNVANDKEKCFIFYISGIPPHGVALLCRPAVVFGRLLVWLVCPLSSVPMVVLSFWQWRRFVGWMLSGLFSAPLAFISLTPGLWLPAPLVSTASDPWSPPPLTPSLHRL